MRQILGNQYEIVRKLGSGGMGEVFLVKDLHLSRYAAAKCVKREQQGSEQFKNEVEWLKELTHPMLPAIYDFFEEHDSYYLIMEYVEGITLEQYLQKNKKVAAEQAVHWAVALTEVMEYLHGRKPPVIYRDLKPDNIMIKPGGGIKLIDLGACKQELPPREVCENFVGTKGYAPPEQWQAGGATVGSDVYALGVILHQMLTGSSPLMAGYMRRPVREYDRSISMRLEQIIEKCTKEQVLDRYRTMKSLREDLLNKSLKEQFIRAGWKIIGFLQVFLWGSVIFSLGWPLVQGVPESAIPFPYLSTPLICGGVALVFQHLFFHRSKQEIKKIEMSILATEKKFDGLLTVK